MNIVQVFKFYIDLDIIFKKGFVLLLNKFFFLVNDCVICNSWGRGVTSQDGALSILQSEYSTQMEIINRKQN